MKRFLLLLALPRALPPAIVPNEICSPVSNENAKDRERMQWIYY